MPSKPKTARREHSPETIAVILKLHALGYSSQKIADETDIPKSTVTSIIRRADLHPNQLYHKAQWTDYPPILNKCAKQCLIQFVVNNLFEILESLSTPSKSGTWLNQKTTRWYLKKNEWYAFRPYCKLYLTKAHHSAQLKWAREYIKWIDEDWDCISFSDELCNLELGFDSCQKWACKFSWFSDYNWAMILLFMYNCP